MLLYANTDLEITEIWLEYLPRRRSSYAKVVVIILYKNKAWIDTPETNANIGLTLMRNLRLLLLRVSNQKPCILI
jgi:hypothetical protein